MSDFHVEGGVVVNVRRIPAEGLSLAGTVVFPAVYDLPTAGPIRYHIHLTPQAENAVYAAGHVTGALRLECIRCLRTFSYEADGPIQAYFTPAVTDDAGRTLPEDEVDIYPVTDGGILLDDAMMGGLYLSIPTYPLCDAACAGLCAKCGAVLNSGSCGHHEALEAVPTAVSLPNRGVRGTDAEPKTQNIQVPT